MTYGMAVVETRPVYRPARDAHGGYQEHIGDTRRHAGGGWTAVTGDGAEVTGGRGWQRDHYTTSLHAENALRTHAAKRAG